VNRPDICVIALDESEHWEFPADLAPFIVRIETVYLYDRANPVHIASLSASYEMWRVETRAVTADGTSDETRETVDAFVHAEDATSDSPAVDYTGTGTIDRIAAAFAAANDEFPRFRTLGDPHSELTDDEWSAFLSSPENQRLVMEEEVRSASASSPI
jgi:hypothetical protein